MHPSLDVGSPVRNGGLNTEAPFDLQRGHTGGCGFGSREGFVPEGESVWSSFQGSCLHPSWWLLVQNLLH